MVRGFVIVGALAVAPPRLLVRLPEELAILVVSSAGGEDRIPRTTTTTTTTSRRYTPRRYGGWRCIGMDRYAWANTHTQHYSRETQKMRRAIYNQIR
jgi:hypothetical protein